MASHEQSAANTPLDNLKLGGALLLVIGAIAAYYVFTDISWAVRAVGVIVAIGAALGIAAFTGPGLRARHFLTESQFELRKVVWPTRQETIQTTIVILIVVLIVSLILWLVDMFLGWAVLDVLLKPGS
jgi:preprotein translocase subunit SecE